MSWCPNVKKKIFLVIKLHVLLLCQDSEKESAKRISVLQQESSDAFDEMEESLKQECILRDAATAIIDQLKDALRSFAVGKGSSQKYMYIIA